MKRYEQYSKNLEILRQAPEEDLNNEFIISGIIDKFSIQFELGWKVLKELLLYEGDKTGKTGSPREVIKASYPYYDFLDEIVWFVLVKHNCNTYV